MNRVVVFLLCIIVVLKINAQLPRVASGSIKRFENFFSNYVDARNVDVWLPDGYTERKKYAVLYMQDGQMLFDSNATWNHLTWNVDDVVGKLIKEKKIKECIVVGIWNGGNSRHADYLPQKPFETLLKNEQDSMYYSKRTNGASVFNNLKVNSDSYLKFLVTELKPFIDSTFSTLKNQSNTLIAGSSMGGLISMYAICEYPEIFGGAACLSTHWTGIFSNKNNPIPAAILKYFKTNIPAPLNHKIYFDYGTATLDSLYEPYQLQANMIMKAKGYTSKNWITKKFVGAVHSESAWGKRFEIPVLFLLKNK